ncbi:MAG: CvpA family protein [Fermentimonas sp.]|jgi:membrane protein required for colicin V production|nr:CvpA family protein [Fermentimonas sp.]MDD4008908.1 CvpA family protein [Fermentimonas sp.]MDD4697384.1 CvpA family protein [Fermentimonas sp.]
MNWFDLTILIFLLLALVKGYRKGFIMQLVGLAVILLAAIFGGKLAEIILPEINRFMDITPSFARALSFLIAFGLIAVVISLVGRLIEKFAEVVLLSFVNRLLGSVIAVGTMMVVLSIVLNLVLMLDKRENIINSEIKQESFFFKRVEAVVPAIVPYLNKEFWEEYIPENYRNEIENKSDSILHEMPGFNNIDSTFQKRHFKVD